MSQENLNNQQNEEQRIEHPRESDSDTWSFISDDQYWFNRERASRSYYKDRRYCSDSEFANSEDQEGPYMLYQNFKLRYPNVGLRYSDPKYQKIAPPIYLNTPVKRMKRDKFEVYLGFSIPEEFTEGDRLFESNATAYLPDFSKDSIVSQVDLRDSIESVLEPYPYLIYHPPLRYWAVQFDKFSYFVYNRFDACGYVGFDYLSFPDNHLQRKIIDKMHCVPQLNDQMSDFNDTIIKIEIPGPYHIVNFTSYGKSVYVQMTDRDIYELSHTNPNMDSLIGLYNKSNGPKKFWYCPYTTCIDFSPHWNGFIFWNSLFFDYEYSNVRLPIDQDYTRQILYTHYYGRKSIDALKEKEANPSDIQIQGLFNMFVFGQSEPEAPGLIESVKQIGKFAETANNVKAKYDQVLNLGWVQEIIQSLSSMTGYFSQLATDFVEFCKDPLGYCERIKNSAYNNMHIPHLGYFDTAKIGLLLVLSFYLYPKSKLISIGLFMYAINSLISSCIEDKQIIRNCTVVVTLCFIGIMKALQPTSASIEIQSFTNLKAIIFTAVSFVTVCFASKGFSKSQGSIIQHLSSNTKNLFNFTRGTLSLVSCIEFVIHTFNLALEYVFGDSIFYKTLVKLTVTSQDLQDYIVYAMTTSSETLAAKLTMDVDAKEKWTQMCKLHIDFVKFFASGKPPTETHIGYSMYSKAYHSFNKLKEEYDKVKDSLTYFRTEPFMVWLWGEPGTGKTFVRDQIVNNIYRWHKNIEPTMSDIKVTGLIYVRNPADKYMSKYNGQFAVAYDDVGQNRQTDNPEFNEIMGFGSTNQVRINMADLADKGKMFSSKLVVMASNSKDVESNNLILKDEAFNRRRHVVIKLDRPKLTENTLSTSKCDFSKVSLTVSDPHNGGCMIRFPREGYGENDQTWIDFYKWLGPHYKKHVITQTEALKQKEAELKAILEDKEHPSIVDLQDVPPVPELNITFGDFTSDLQLNTSIQGGNDFNWYNDALDNPFTSKIQRPPHCDSIFKRIYYLRNINEEFDTCASGVLDSKPYGDDDPQSSVPWITFFHACKKWIGRTPTEKEIAILKTLRSEVIEEITEEEKAKLAELFEEWSNYKPSWVKLGAYAASGLALLGVWKVCSSLFQGKDDLFDVQSYSLNTQAPKTNQVTVQSYSLETKAPKTNSVIVQSSVDLGKFCSEKPSLGDDVMRVYQKNFARFSHMLCEGITFQHVNALHIGATAWLVPHHFVLDKDEFHLLVKRDNVAPVQVSVQRKDIIQIDRTDLCIIHIPALQHGRNIVNHFATREQLAMVRNFDASVLTWDISGAKTSIAHVGQAYRWDIPLEVPYENKTLYYPRGYNYNWKSVAGDCGSVLISKDNTCVAKILGIHFGYDFGMKVAKSVIISRELLQEYMMRVVPKVDMIDVQEPKIEVQSSPVPPELMKDGKPIFEYFGTVADGPLTPRRHKDLFRSPMFDTVYPHEKDLSVLSKNDSRMLEEFKGDPDILTRGVIDFAYESRPWPTVELKIAKEALHRELTLFHEVIPREVCSLDWAINGTWIGSQRMECTEPLNLKTSAGYGLPGKKLNHFTTTEVSGKVTHKISNPVLQQMVDDQWNDWMEGKTHPTIWAHALKSEPVKLSKIVNGNTRTFCVAQTSFLINVRRLFGSFTVAMKNSKIKSFSCLGMDSFSGDWNALYDELRKTGPTGIDMDFFKYDRTAVTWQLARAVVEVINRWYDDDESYQRARIIAFEDLIFSYALIGKHLTRKVRGNPSGNPLTTELNNCINYLMLVMVYMIVAKERSPTNYTISSFIKNISVKTYGDDIIFSVHPECVPWLDVNRIEEIYKFYGVPVTPADKSDKGLSYRPISELTFLKCEFLPFSHPLYKWQAGLSKMSIRNMIQFYRLKPGNGTEDEACLTNCEESLRFAYHWGRDFFEDHLSRINKRLKELTWPLIAATYEEYDFVYRSKLI